MRVLGLRPELINSTLHPDTGTNSGVSSESMRSLGDTCWEQLEKELLCSSEKLSLPSLQGVREEWPS